MLEDVRSESAENSPVHEYEEEESEPFVQEITAAELGEESEYFYPKSCYTCKARFLKRHHFYDRVRISKFATAVPSS